MEKEKELFLKELFDDAAVPYEKEEENFFGEEEFENEERVFEQEEAEKQKEAFFAFANAIGKEPEEVFEIMKKGSEFDELSEKFLETKGDSEIFEKLAEIRGISKNEMKDEILWALEKATTEKMISEIMEANPGMNRETAKELALFRLQAEKAETGVLEKDSCEAMLSELEKFAAKHAGEGIEKLSNGVVEEWEGGIPLETAFEKHRLFKENEKLLSEIEKLKQEQERETRKIYAREHSTGSATSAAGNVEKDEFVAGLFKEY